MQIYQGLFVERPGLRGELTRMLCNITLFDETNN